MRKALFAGVVVAALAYAAPATAGCWATAQLAPPPAGTSTGRPGTPRSPSSSTAPIRCPNAARRGRP